MISQRQPADLFQPPRIDSDLLPLGNPINGGVAKKHIDCSIPDSGRPTRRRRQITRRKTTDQRTEQPCRRGEGKIGFAAEKSGQTELFASLSTLSSSSVDVSLAGERHAARGTMLSLVPAAPEAIAFSDLWPQVLSVHVVRKSVVGQIGASLRKDGLVAITNWERGRKVPQEASAFQLPATIPATSTEGARSIKMQTTRCDKSNGLFDRGGRNEEPLPRVD